MAAAGLLDHGEGLGQKLIQQFLVFPPLLPAIGYPLFELDGLALKFGLGQPLTLPKMPIDLPYQRLEFLGIPLIFIAEYCGQYLPEHNFIKAIIIKHLPMQLYHKFFIFASK
jgi:hypothetical protein